MFNPIYTVKPGDHIILRRVYAEGAGWTVPEENANELVVVYAIEDRMDGLTTVKLKSGAFLKIPPMAIGDIRRNEVSP